MYSYEIKTELQITLLTRHEKIKDRRYSLLSVFLKLLKTQLKDKIVGKKN